MMCRKPKSQEAITSMDFHFLNNLNHFYGRFDTPGNKDKSNAICANIPQTPTIQLSEEQFTFCLSRINLCKAPGPDGLRGRVLKMCAAQLTSVLTKLLQLLLHTCIVPETWKSSIIRPLPKMPGPKELNDFRPFALTSVLAKCMERVVSKHLTAALGQKLDPLQFAYKTCRGTGDATLTMVNMVAKHLQNTNTYARILFISFIKFIISFIISLQPVTPCKFIYFCNG